MERMKRSNRKSYTMLQPCFYVCMSYKQREVQYTVVNFAQDGDAIATHTQHRFWRVYNDQLAPTYKCCSRASKLPEFQILSGSSCKQDHQDKTTVESIVVHGRSQVILVLNY